MSLPALGWRQDLTFPTEIIVFCVNTSARMNDEAKVDHSIGLTMVQH